MARKDGARESLLTCAEVRDRIYPLLLRTVSAREHDDVMQHAGACEACRVTLEVVRERLGRLGGVSLPDLGERRPARPRGRRIWLTWLAFLPAVVAWGLLIRQGIRMAGYQQERRFFVRLQKAILTYREDFGTYPPSDGAPLSVFLSTTEKSGPYLDVAHERVDAVGHFLDRWGRVWVYRFPGVRNPRLFDLQSLGGNGRDDNGRSDDIANY